MNSFLRRPSSMKSFKAPGWWNVCYFLTYVTAEFHGKASPSSPAARREEPGHSYPLGRFVRPDLQEICIIPLTVIGWISAWLYPTRKQREEEVDRGSGGQLIICAMHFKHKSIPGYVLWDHVPSWGTLTAFGHQRKRTTHAPAFRKDRFGKWGPKKVKLKNCSHFHISGRAASFRIWRILSLCLLFEKTLEGHFWHARLRPGQKPSCGNEARPRFARECDQHLYFRQGSNFGELLLSKLVFFLTSAWGLKKRKLGFGTQN